MTTKLWTNLSDAQAEKVVGGVGVEVSDAGFGAGTWGWVGGPKHHASGDFKGLFNAGFMPGTTIEAGPNTVFVPGDK